MFHWSFNFTIHACYTDIHKVASPIGYDVCKALPRMHDGLCMTSDSSSLELASETFQTVSSNLTISISKSFSKLTKTD